MQFESAGAPSGSRDWGRKEMNRTVILDNYDSFTYNISQVLGSLGVEAEVIRNDGISIAELSQLHPGRIIISPGPGSPENPRDFGVCLDAIRVLGQRIPVLGICLGHQGIGYAFGAKVTRAPQPMHGKKSKLTNSGNGLFAGLPRSFEVMRYHSLAIDPATVPTCLEVAAVADDGVIMAVRHKAFPIFGVQFHPESVGTPLGPKLLENFIKVKPR